MIYWVPFLHFYQPPTQSHAVLKKVSNESYRPLLKMFLEHPYAKVTINICGVLTEMLNEHAANDVIESIIKLAANKQLEFVDSAKYHAILPLIPQKEIRRQIEQNNKTNTYFFKEVYKVRGFFPPEMCYSKDVASVLTQMNYEWVLISGIACPVKWPLDVIYRATFGKSALNIFYRDDILSNKVSFRNIDSAGFISTLINLSKGKKDIYVITAMDAETFGHHIQNWERLFLAKLYEKILESKEIEVLTISELLEKFPIKVSQPPRPSSWSTTKQDILTHNYYPLWKNPHNKIHSLQWEHVKICLELIYKAFSLKNNKARERFYNNSRTLMDRALHSCQFWWANTDRMWEINMVNKGLILQEEAILNAYKSIYTSIATKEVKKKFYHKVIVARNIAHKIRDELFEYG